MRVLDGCGGYADVGAVLSAGVATRRGTGPVSACAGVVAMRGIGETGSTAARGNGLTSLSALTATPGVRAVAAVACDADAALWRAKPRAASQTQAAREAAAGASAAAMASAAPAQTKANTEAMRKLANAGDSASAADALPPSSTESAVRAPSSLPKPSARRRVPYSVLVPPSGVTAGVTLGAVASAPLPEGVLPPALGDFGTGETALPACAKGLASLRVRAHFGAFERLFGDWSSLQARLDLGSSALGVDAKPKGARSAALALSATQQLVGPLRLRADATVGLDSRAAARSRRAGGPTLRDRVIDGAFALDCAVVPGGAARAVLWWSPVRNEAMAEVRLLEI